MRLLLSPEAHAGLRTLPPGPKRAMRAALRSLADDPSGRSTGSDVERLRFAGREPFFRLRVGSYRAMFAVESDAVKVLEVFHRQEGYRWLEERYPGRA